MATLKFASPEIRVGLDSSKSSPLIKMINSPMPKDEKRIVKKAAKKPMVKKQIKAKTKKK